MEDTGGKGGIRMTLDEGVAEMLLAPGSAAGDDGDREVVGQFTQGLVGVAVLRTVVIHRGEEDLAGTTLLSLVGPFKQASFRALATAFQITVPTVFVKTGINGADTDL